MSMNNIFLIKTPLQLLNAVEAKHKFNLKSDDCALIIMGDRKSQPQILSLANAMDEWGKVIILNTVNLFYGDPFESKGCTESDNQPTSAFLSKSFFNVRRLNRISKYLGSVENIFIGYARYVYMRHFVNTTPHKKTFLLDDGNATIKLAKERREGLGSPVYHGFLKKLKIFFKRYLQGVKDGSRDSLCFFTVYDVIPGKNDEVIKNDFEYIKSNLGALETTNDVYFLGSPLCEAGIMSQESYLNHIQRVKDFYKNKILIYIAHRRESSESLNKIKQDLNINVVLYDYPIEYQLAMIGPRPAILASFISSALLNCSYIFGEGLDVVAFKMDLEGNPRKDEIESVYDSYVASENMNFHIENGY